MPDVLARWLHPRDAAVYVGRRVDELPRLVKRGLLPEPSYHFGPRSPRYDRLALDAAFGGGDAPTVSIDRAIAAAADEIAGMGRPKRRLLPRGKGGAVVPMRRP